MDHSFDQQEFVTQKPGNLSARRQIFDHTLHWLAGLVLLTEEEQREAGIFIGNYHDWEFPRFNRYP